MNDGSNQAVGSLIRTRLSVEKAGGAADLLRRRGGGVMDLIAHFWDRLPQTPPLLRDDLHLLIAWRRPDGALDTADAVDMNRAVGAMLYVPKAQRADVFAPSAEAAAVFSGYLADWVARNHPPSGPDQAKPDENRLTSTNTFHNKNIPINYITGEAVGIDAMLANLLTLVNRKAPAKKTLNVMMRLPDTIKAQMCPRVRSARNGDESILNKWRKSYKQERGILFDADVDAWIESGNVFVYELDGNVVAMAKFDLILPNIVEIGGVFTFPEFRKHGIGGQLVRDLVCRIRSTGKTPLLQVDVTNELALNMYRKAGWVEIGQLVRVWLAVT